MPEHLEWNRPTAGWIPSDSAITGRKNGLFKMNNVELDQNGAVVLSGGTKQIRTYNSSIHSIYSRIMNGSRKDYASLVDGSCYRDDTEIIAAGAGSLDRAAFGTAFDFSLICSGNKRLKDPGNATPVNLGIVPPNLPVKVQRVENYATPLLLATGKTTVIHIEPTPAPQQNPSTSGDVAAFNSGEGWQTMVPGATISYDSGPYGSDSSVKINTTNYNSTVHGAFVEYSSPHDLTFGSNVNDDDMLTMWFKFHWNPLNYDNDYGFAVAFYDVDGNKVQMGISNWTIANQDAWVPIRISRKAPLYGDIVGTNPSVGFDGSSLYISNGTSFDWTKISKIEVSFGIPYGLNDMSIYFGGWTFDGTYSPVLTPPPTDIVTDTSTDPTIVISGTKKGQISFQGVVAAPLDWGTLIDTFDSSATTYGIADDTLTVNMQVGQDQDVASIDWIDVNILLEPPTQAGYLPSKYANYRILNTTFNDTTIKLRMSRGDFLPVGVSMIDWSKVYGINIMVAINGPLDITILGSLIANVATEDVYFGMYGGQIALQGNYQYAQMNVNNTGSYLAKSVLGPTSDPITLDRANARLQIQNPIPLDPQVNEVWIFRRGGSPDVNSYYPSTTLDKWYRIAILTKDQFNQTFLDQVPDQTAIKTNITVNLNLISIASTSVKDPILAIIGPIQGRWYYFTTNFMYPSDVNDPDLVDASEAIRTCGGVSETFMWADGVGESVVLVGTSCDVYILTGTFITLPDNTVDIFYRPLTVKFPPISTDCGSFGSNIYYLSNDGWRSVDPNSTNPLLVAPNTDRLYKDKICYDYNPPNLHIQPGEKRFPVTVGKNRLYCCIAEKERIEVYDFIRQYWRVITYGLGDVTAIFSTQDGEVLAAFGTILREIDRDDNKLIDEVTNQTVTLLLPILDGGDARRRKDNYTLKLRIYTGGSGSITPSFFDEDKTEYTAAVQSSTSKVIEKIIDLSGLKKISKTWQFKLTGQVSDFTFEDLSIDYDLRPTQLTFLRLSNSNFGTSSKKRVRVWPAVLDTLGNNVTFTPEVDNETTAATILTTLEKLTKNIFFKTDVFGIDYGATLSGGPFEFWGMLDPDVVQVLPIARQYDQVGPEDLFRYGRIKEFEYRVLPLGTSIPYTIFFNDNTKHTSSITVTSGEEASYFVGVPKGTAGNIVRMVFGPTTFDFHRFYIRLKVFKTGKDTETEWVMLPPPQGIGG